MYLYTHRVQDHLIMDIRFYY